MGHFTDKVAIVTGAASGIGEALGKALAQSGATVILADINAPRLNKVAESIINAGHAAEATPLDISNYEDVKKLVADTASTHGRLDFIFNNAGIAVGAEVRDCSIEDWRDVLKMIKIDREKVLADLPDRLGITPQECARVILKGVERNKAIIVVTALAKFLWMLQRISPNLILWMMGRNLKKSRKEMRLED